MAETDRSILITGGTRGLGLETARLLARDPRNRVIITGRDAERTAGVARRIGAYGRVLDLASLASIRTCADGLVADLRDGRHPQLRVVLCNAGLQIYRRAYTADGFELTFGANHLGHVALVEALLDEIRAPGRIVFTASGTHDPDTRTFSPPPLPAGARELAYPSPGPPSGDNARQDGMRRYATSKLANVRTAYELARRLADRGIDVNAFDPGLMPGTGLVREGPRALRLVWHTAARALTLLPGVNSVTTSAADLAHLATAPALDGITGRYFIRRQPAQSSRASHDVHAQRALYTDSLALLDEAGARSAVATGD
jgi:NAD(P)-dependent dehydrogenase (short-subunit alcohol dehydrogenase family)